MTVRRLVIVAVLLVGCMVALGGCGGGTEEATTAQTEQFLDESYGLMNRLASAVDTMGGPQNEWPEEYFVDGEADYGAWQDECIAIEKAVDALVVPSGVADLADIEAHLANAARYSWEYAVALGEFMTAGDNILRAMGESREAKSKLRAELEAAVTAYRHAQAMLE